MSQPAYAVQQSDMSYCNMGGTARVLCDLEMIYCFIHQQWRSAFRPLRVQLVYKEQLNHSWTWIHHKILQLIIVPSEIPCQSTSPLPACQYNFIPLKMPFTMHKLHALSLFLSCINAIPTPQEIGAPLPVPNCDFDYTKTSENTLEGAPMTSDRTVPGGKNPFVELKPNWI